MTPCQRGHDAKHRLFDIDYRVDSELAGGNASTCSPTEKSHGSQNSQVHCNKGFDMIENFFSTIFGGCCRPVDLAEPGGVKGTQSSSSRNVFKEKTPRRRRVDGLVQLPQPPQIRRLALEDDDLGDQQAMDRSGSLDFLFYQDGASSSP